MAAVASDTLTLDEYLRTMEPWAARTVARSVRNSHALLQREDLMQEARLTLVEVFEKYAGKVPELDLRKMGTRSVFFHVGNLYYRAASQSRGGMIVSPLEKDEDAVVRRAKLRGRRIREDVKLTAKSPRRLRRGVGMSLPLEGSYDDGDVIENIADMLAARRGGRVDALDGMILMEAVERVAAESDEARAVLASVLDVSDTRPAGPLDGAAFRRVQKKVRALLYADGYRRQEATDPETEDDMTPDSPDETVAAETPAAPKAAKKATAAKAPKAKPEAAKKVSAAETKAASEKFKKDQQVTYKGGARASWLKSGAALKVLGTVVSRGRTYVRCYAESQKKGVTLSASHLSK